MVLISRWAYPEDLFLAHNAHISAIGHSASVFGGDRARFIEIFHPILIESVERLLLIEGYDCQFCLCVIHDASCL